MTSLTLTIEGMSCANCVAHVREALEELPGVEVESVEIGSAQLRLADEAPEPIMVAEAVSGAGYPALVG